MIYRLEIENFHSIKERQVLDLTVSEKVRRNPERFAEIHPGSPTRVPKVIAAFGANGAGKTTLLRALAFVAWFMRDSFQQPPEAALPVVPFNDQDGPLRQTRLALSFGGPTNLGQGSGPEEGFGTYDFEIVIGSGDRTNKIMRESLRHRRHGTRRPVRVFERNENGEVLEGEHFPLAGYRPVIDKPRPNASVISTLASFDHAPSVELRDAARSVVSNLSIVDQDDSSDNRLLTALAANPSLLEALNREIPRVGLGIRSLRPGAGPRGPGAQINHRGLINPIPWHLESAGTRCFIRTFPLVAAALESGGLAVIDRFDSALHPTILAELVRWFHDPERNPLNAGLWIGCQNAALMEELDKEEIVLCEKDGFGRTRIYPLQEVEGVRRIDNFHRKYMSGAYGAVPTIG